MIMRRTTCCCGAAGQEVAPGNDRSAAQRGPTSTQRNHRSQAEEILFAPREKSVVGGRSGRCVAPHPVDPPEEGRGSNHPINRPKLNISITWN